MVAWSKVAMARLTALLLLPVFFEAVFSISFFLPVNSRKCLREEIHKDVLVTGEYEIAEQANTKTNLKVSTDLRLASVKRNQLIPRPKWLYSAAFNFNVGCNIEMHNLILNTR